MKWVAFAVVATMLAGCGASKPANTAADAVADAGQPGPAALYEAPGTSPALENTGIWNAEPILVSGAVAYRGGEFLYQDFLFDDHGALGTADSTNPYDVGGYLFSPVAGTYTYPTDASKYAYNAADLVEWRFKPLADALAFRITLNTLIDPELVGFTIALADLGSRTATVAAADWPHGAGVSSGSTHFVTVHGTTADLINSAGETLLPAPTVTVDLARKQFDVRTPRAAFDPVNGVLGVTVGVGLWDAANDAYLAPTEGSANATTPGGGSPLGVAIVNVGPRLNEPQPDVKDPYGPFTIGDAAAGGTVQARWWREKAQADALQLGDVSAFSAAIDLGKLAAGVNDDSLVPSVGSINRILVSRYSFGQGLDPTRVCFDIGSSIDVGAACEGRYVGELQPYTLYIPDKPVPPKGWGMTLLLHSLSANYNQYAASLNQSQLGDRGEGSLVITPNGRGPDGFYAGVPEADTFEVWADVARHYPLDPDWTVVSGYSMGGFGTYRMLARYPDLFARGFSVVGIPGDVDPNLAALRNVPLMTWNCYGDELVNIQQSMDAESAMTDAGLRHESWFFPGADHLTLATNDEYTPGAEFLGTHRVDRNPPHVTYVVNKAEDSAYAVADKAYWLSAIRARDEASPGTIDVKSKGFGVEDAPVIPTAQGAGVLEGGSHGAMAYESRTMTWGEAPAMPARNELDITATNIAAVTIDPKRARVTCGAKLNVTSDGPVAVTLAGC